MAYFFFSLYCPALSVPLPRGTSYNPWVCPFSPNASHSPVQPLFLSHTSMDTGLSTTPETAYTHQNIRGPSGYWGVCRTVQGLLCILLDKFFKPILCLQIFPAVPLIRVLLFCPYSKYIIQCAPGSPPSAPNSTRLLNLSTLPCRATNFPLASTAECEHSALPVLSWESANRFSRPGPSLSEG